MAFDRNPRANEADNLIVAQTTEDVVRAIAAALATDAHVITRIGRNVAPGTGVNALAVLGALVERFDRKAVARADKAA